MNLSDLPIDIFDHISLFLGMTDFDRLKAFLPKNDFDRIDLARARRQEETMVKEFGSDMSLVMGLFAVRKARIYGEVVNAMKELKTKKKISLKQNVLDFYYKTFMFVEPKVAHDLPSPHGRVIHCDLRSCDNKNSTRNNSRNQRK